MTTWSDPPRPESPEPGPQAADPQAPNPQAPNPRAADPLAGTGVGLAVVHEALERLVTTHRLRALTVVVDDPDLGRQAFRAGPGPFDPGSLGGEPGCRAQPPLAPDVLDGELLVALCAAALRVEVLRDDAHGPAALELAIRRLPGVANASVERDDDALVVTIDAGLDAPGDLGRVAARLATEHAAAAPVVIELVATSVAVPERPAARSAAAGSAADASRHPTIVAVRTAPDAGEIEVHLRAREARTVGRAPTADGLVGAAGATLDALRQAGRAADATVAWARTVETAPGRFVVAVALQDGPGIGHGVGTGSSPLEAAARAALDATRGDG